MEHGEQEPHGNGWNVYVDGLNFYAAVAGSPKHKWIDFHQLASRLIPSGASLREVKYFTSQISAKASEDPAAPARQRVLMRAVRSSGVLVFEGKFKVPEGWRSLSSKGEWMDRFRPELPSPVLNMDPDHFATHSTRPWKVLVELPQEKFTDVAIASHLVRDFYMEACDGAVVVSNDSDLVPAIELVVADGHPVKVISPVQTVSRDLAAAATNASPIRRELLAICQMADVVTDSKNGRKLHRPDSWK